MFCQNCGNKLDENAVICSNCGTSVHDETAGKATNDSVDLQKEQEGNSHITPNQNSNASGIPPQSPPPNQNSNASGIPPQSPNLNKTENASNGQAQSTTVTRTVTTEDKPNVLVNFLSLCCIPILGIIMYFVWKDTHPKGAKSALIFSLINIGLGIIFYILIFVFGIFASVVDPNV